MLRLFATFWMSLLFAFYVGSMTLAVDVARAAIARKQVRNLLGDWYHEHDELKRGLYMFDLIDRARLHG